MQTGYVHLIYGPCVEAGGRLRPGLQPSSFAIDYASEGCILLQSSGASALRDYEVYHSPGDYFMGILCRQWHYLGRVGEYFHGILRNPAPMNAFEVMGPAFTQVLLRGNSRGTVDAFFSRGWHDVNIAHYELLVHDASAWWQAQRYIFHGRVNV